jgi:putative acetyltransferase
MAQERDGAAGDTGPGEVPSASAGPGEVVVTVEDPTTPDALALIRLLSAELAAAYNFMDDGSGAFSPADVQVPRAAFLVVRLDGRPVGCGALRPLDLPGFEDSAEIKRMFVVEEARGRRLAVAILTRLEGLAREFGYRRAVLETGNLQHAAIRLYERSGYARIACYGRYTHDPRSICFGRAL